MIINKLLRYLLYASSFLVLINSLALAEDECFCFKHKKTDAVLFDCSEFQGPDDFYTTIRCKTKIVTGKKKRIDIKKVKYTKDENWDKEWEKIESGKTDCDPCKGRPHGIIVPKGGD